MKKTSDRDAQARLRFAIVGPLLAAPPEGRQLQLALHDLAAREWTHPGSGTPVRFGVSTIERWYYLARTATDPVAALRRRVRLDKGRARALPVAITELVRAQHREHPGWTAQLHHDNLGVLVNADATLGPMPSYSTVRRFLRANGLERQPTPKRASAGAERARDRHERLETRSYEAAHVNGLWHLDFHHGSRPVLEANGRWLKPRLLGVIDDHSRLVCHLQWYRNEDTESLVHGFCQALARRSLPRALMSDYVARNIIALLLPSPLCGRPAREGRRGGRRPRSRQHNDHSDFSHFSRPGSSRHRELPREVSGPTLSSEQTSSASAFIASEISA